MEKEILEILKAMQQDIKGLKESQEGVASGKCGFHTLRAFSPLIPMVCRLFRYSKVYIVP